MALPTPFLDFDGDRIAKILEAATSPDAKANRPYFDGDHWQQGEGWIGPRPQPGETGEQETMLELERAFTSSNKVAEVCERHSDGIAGREPRWSLTPIEPVPDGEEIPEPLQVLIAEAEAALTRWWNGKRVHQYLMDAVTTLMWAERGPLRLYVPAGYLGEGGSIERFESLEAALEAVFIEVPAPEIATVYVDPATKHELGIITYERVNEAGEEEEVVEVVFVDDLGNTVIRQIVGDDAQDFLLSFGGRITMHEMRRTRFVTPQVRQNQRALNLALSTIPRNVTTAGFLERILLNAQMPGRWEVDPATGERKRFIPEPFRTGAATTQFVAGIEQTDAQGNISHATPSVQFRDPVDPSGAQKSADEHYRRILEEADQLHVLMSADATASAVSRVEARSDYIASLRRTVPLVEAAGRWLVGTALAVAEQLTGTPGRFTESLRAEFNCRLSTGHIAPTERAQNVSEVEAGLMPQEYAMSENGIDDVDAALAMIHSRPETQIALLRRRAEVFKLLTEAGADLQTAATLAGFDEEEIRLLTEPQDPVRDGRPLEQ
jgi:hypothetical protein